MNIIIEILFRIYVAGGFILFGVYFLFNPAKARNGIVDFMLPQYGMKKK